MIDCLFLSYESKMHAIGIILRFSTHENLKIEVNGQNIYNFQIITQFILDFKSYKYFQSHGTLHSSMEPNSQFFPNLGYKSGIDNHFSWSKF